MTTHSISVPDSVPPVKLALMLRRATMEGKAAAADLCSVRLEKLANHAANAGLSAAEIVELTRRSRSH
jgi:hypothetical protein